MQKIYLKKFYFSSYEKESKILSEVKMTCFNNFYPFGTLPEDFKELDFYPLTILYGGVTDAEKQRF